MVALKANGNIYFKKYKINLRKNLKYFYTQTQIYTVYLLFVYKF